MFVTVDTTTSTMCWVSRPFTQANMSTLAYESTQTVIAGINAFSPAAETAPKQSGIEATEFVIPALEGATTLMAAFVTGAAATLLF